MVNRRIGGPGGGSDPGGGKGAGTLIAATAFVLVVGGTTGAISIAGGTTGSGAATDSALSRDLNIRKNEGKKSAKKGKPEEAWNRLGLRSLKKTLRNDARCIAASTDQIRDFFLRTPCKALDRSLVAVGDGRGNSAVISVAWVSFRSRADATDFEQIEKVHGNGDITPLAGAVLGLADIHFTGHHFDSRRDGRVVAVAEAETASGHVDNTVLEALTEVAVWLPKP